MSVADVMSDAGDRLGQYLANSKTFGLAGKRLKIYRKVARIMEACRIMDDSWYPGGDNSLSVYIEEALSKIDMKPLAAMDAAVKKHVAKCRRIRQRKIKQLAANCQ